MSGKGSDQRPKSPYVSDQEFADNWEKIFGKEKPDVKVRKQTPAHAKTQVQKDKTKYDRKKLDRSANADIIDV